MFPSQWKRLLRFIPKGEKIACYGEPQFNKDQHQTYINHKIDKLKARVLAVTDVELGVFHEVNMIKEVGTIMAPIHSSPIILNAVANHHSNYKATGISYTDFPAINFKILRMYGGTGSVIIIPAGTMASAMNITCGLGVITKEIIFNNSPEECRNRTLGFVTAIDVHLQELGSYYDNPSLTSIRNFKAYTFIGPWIVSPDEISNVDNLNICLSYENRILQYGNTSDTIYKTYDLMSNISRGIRIRSGSLIITGSPEPSKLSNSESFIEIKDGGTLVGSVEKIGFVDVTLRLVVASELCTNSRIGDKLI